MAERDYDESNEALDPELLYTKEYCIGQTLADALHRDYLRDYC